MLDATKYEGREQAYVKHFVLNTYLQVLAFKLGNFKPGTTIRYVDGFSGPWEEQSATFEDTSPYIALKQLSGAQSDLEAKGTTLNIACMFIEKKKSAVAKLRQLCTNFPDVDVDVFHGKFEDQIPDVVRFARGGRTSEAVRFATASWDGKPCGSSRP